MGISYEFLKGSENVLVLEGGRWEVTGNGRPAGRLCYLAGMGASEFVEGQSPLGAAQIWSCLLFSAQLTSLSLLLLCGQAKPAVCLLVTSGDFLPFKFMH